MIDAFVDAGLFNPKKNTVYYVLFGGIGLIFYGWWESFMNDIDAGMIILYLGVVAIGCGTWVIIQIALLIFSKNYRGVQYLLLGSFAGGFGLLSIMEGKWMIWLCEHLSCYFGTDFIWFIVTDIAIYFIYKYYVARHTISPSVPEVEMSGERLLTN